MRIFVLTATYELRVSRKNHLRDHPRQQQGMKARAGTPAERMPAAARTPQIIAKNS
jgi:hypothetical protein